MDSLVDDAMASTEFLRGDSSDSLYTNSTLSSDEESSANSSVESGLGELKDHAEEVNNVAEGNFHPSEVAVLDNDCSSSSKGLYPNFDSQSSMPTQISGEYSIETMSSGNSECEDTLVGKVVGDITFASAVPSMENHSNTSFNDSDIDTEDKEFSHLESSIDLSMEEKNWCELEGLDDSNNNITEDVPTTSEFSESKIDSIIHSADSSGIDLDYSANLSLEEKVANFIQNGDLDPAEGNSNM